MYFLICTWQRPVTSRSSFPLPFTLLSEAKGGEKMCVIHHKVYLRTRIHLRTSAFNCFGPRSACPFSFCCRCSFSFLYLAFQRANSHLPSTKRFHLFCLPVVFLWLLVFVSRWMSGLKLKVLKIDRNGMIEEAMWDDHSVAAEGTSWCCGICSSYMRPRSGATSGVATLGRARYSAFNRWQERRVVQADWKMCACCGFPTCCRFLKISWT
jgi:hypothetical protein